LAFLARHHRNHTRGNTMEPKQVILRVFFALNLIPFAVIFRSSFFWVNYIQFEKIYQNESVSPHWWEQQLGKTGHQNETQSVLYIVQKYHNNTTNQWLVIRLLLILSNAAVLILKSIKGFFKVFY
jgi:hypothetical protein